MKLDTKNTSRNNSILFIKNIGTQSVVIVSFDEGENGKIVLHKTFYDKVKAGRFDKLPSIKLSPEVDIPPSVQRLKSLPPVAFPLLTIRIKYQISFVQSSPKMFPKSWTRTVSRLSCSTGVLREDSVFLIPKDTT